MAVHHQINLPSLTFDFHITPCTY